MARREAELFREALARGDEHGWESADAERDALFVLICSLQRLARLHGVQADEELRELTERLARLRRGVTTDAGAGNGRFDPTPSAG